MSYTYKDYETGDEYDSLSIHLKDNVTVKDVEDLAGRIAWETDGEFYMDFDMENYRMTLCIYPSSMSTWNSVINVLREVHDTFGTVWVSGDSGVLDLDFKLPNPFHYDKEE